MMTKTFTIINKLGLHARAAAKFVTTASAYDAEITVTRENRTVNGKSIMGVMMLAAAKGSQITVTAEGDDAEQALQALDTLINDFFGEGE
ncbi:MAG TPA: HPr family phosphocarrier protein [Methylophaga aminisulfidivorans]|jgi:phosphocarrier protein HPr|uniref:Sugar transport PTS system phosphocarrier protein HPR n=2 Tax=Methylophaga TaxID=40222 RepID=F5T193_9GAMM|nr:MULTISPECIES: HPr family phosphocarrier protein [Methylophaga]EGL53797.1 sugar transport PTS system phosphocarrier protein HPR [Methylophaga aminisulfidivorans MP]WVI85186.1 HPr family phosphocarrier protein [Methylophaga thalassica]GLQ00281.1 HPr kinase [Methylophaga thalassica]HIC45878.1 HPr family phosphocarrier protein [Methylophaga sp.]HIM38474.1 HPr family phosphocarrier protein [Methylophaga aminisulfidivorans]